MYLEEISKLEELDGKWMAYDDVAQVKLDPMKVQGGAVGGDEVCAEPSCLRQGAEDGGHQERSQAHTGSLGRR